MFWQIISLLYIGISLINHSDTSVGWIWLMGGLILMKLDNINHLK